MLDLNKNKIMAHRLVEYEKEHGSASEHNLLPDILWCLGIPTHEDWKSMKKNLKIKNSDIAEITGLTVDSVKTMTQPNRELPAWAKSMIFVWKRLK